MMLGVFSGRHRPMVFLGLWSTLTEVFELLTIRAEYWWFVQNLSVIGLGQCPVYNCGTEKQAAHYVTSMPAVPR